LVPNNFQPEKNTVVSGGGRMAEQLKPTVKKEKRREEKGEDQAGPTFVGLFLYHDILCRGSDGRRGGKDEGSTTGEKRKREGRGLTAFMLQGQQKGRGGGKKEI